MDLLGLTKKRKREEVKPSVVFNKAEEQEANDTDIIGYDDIPSLEEAGFKEENGQIVKVSDPFELDEELAHQEKQEISYADKYSFTRADAAQKRTFEAKSFIDFALGYQSAPEVDEPGVESEQYEEEPEPAIEVEQYEEEIEPAIEVEQYQEEEPDDQSEPIQEEEKSDNEPEPIQEEKPFIAKLTPDHYELGKDSYQKAFSISAEALAISVLEHNQVTNMSLSAFGEFGKMYQPQVLSVIEFGAHRFIGRGLSNIEKMKLFYQIEKFFMESKEDSMVLKLTQAITFQEVKYLTLIATPDELREYSAMFFQEVSVNLLEPDENNLVAVIKRCR